MKQVLFLFLLLPLFTVAQRQEWDIAYQKSIPAGLGKPVHMPERDYNPHYDIDNFFKYDQKGRVFVITADSVYRKAFWRYVYTQDSLKKYRQSAEISEWSYKWMVTHLVDSLPAIDFAKNELVVYSACAQCFANCEHDEGSDSCHRNVCMFRETFYLREKKK